MQKEIWTNAGSRKKKVAVQKTLGDTLDCIFNSFHSATAGEARHWARRQQPKAIGTSEDKTVHKMDVRMAQFVVGQMNIDNRMLTCW